MEAKDKFSYLMENPKIIKILGISLITITSTDNDRFNSIIKEKFWKVRKNIGKKRIFIVNFIEQIYTILKC